MLNGPLRVAITTDERSKNTYYKSVCTVQLLRYTTNATSLCTQLHNNNVPIITAVSCIRSHTIFCWLIVIYILKVKSNNLYTH